MARQIEGRKVSTRTRENVCARERQTERSCVQKREREKSKRRMSEGERDCGRGKGQGRERDRTRARAGRGVVELNFWRWI
jgi:hypothetical protein